MLHLRSYVGSIVLAGLLLQGCGGSSESTPTAEVTQSSAEVIKAENTINAINQAFAGLNASSTDAEIEAATREAKLLASQPSLSTASAAQTAGLFSKITDKVKDGLVKVLDTSLGNKVTSAAFDVVLNSEGVTVVMIDLARKSETTAQIMVDAMEADWSLTTKMCPMLRESTEFGEKFTALAEERATVGTFFFERIDSQMYGCLTDAMLLSNNDAVHDKDVSHSTNAYMGILMDRYATDYFITPDATITDRNRRLNDNFVSLLLDTGAAVDYNSTAKTFENHGDGNELINEKFFYSLFKTPGTTDAFVAAMDKVKAADAANGSTTLTLLMDNIFLGQPQDTTADADTVQGYLNIISIGSAMYDGIYGVKGAEGARTGGYGFGSYTGAFIGFAGLIPTDRYMTYGRAFMNAGYEYAKFHGIDVWDGVSEAAQTAWNEYTTPADANTTAAGAPARSAGLGLVSSDWYDDTLDLMINAWSNISLTEITAVALDSNKSIMSELQDQGNVAYGTFIDGKDANGNTAYYTEISNGAHANQDVSGIHGLIELAMQEDIYYVNCGNRSYDYALVGFSNDTCDNNASYTMDDAKAAFTLPAFSDLTMEFAYNTAYDGAMGYYDSNVDENWVADLSTNELIREYFYPAADNVYIPNWLLAVDWLSAPANFSNTNVATTDFDFNAGYFDIYVTSTNAALFTVTDENNVTTGGDIDLTVIAGLLKEIEVTKVDMGNDDIIAVDENGQNIDGLNVYKIRAITPEDTQAMMNALTALSDDALTAIGLDSSNAANVDTTETAAN